MSKLDDVLASIPDANSSELESRSRIYQDKDYGNVVDLSERTGLPKKIGRVC